MIFMALMLIFLGILLVLRIFWKGVGGRDLIGLPSPGVKHANSD